MEKRSLDNTPEDETIAQRLGWEGLRVWWLVSKESTASQGVVLNLTIFTPGKPHELHRHPNAEEVTYILKGSGLATSDRGSVRQNEGEAIYVPRAEWHGFQNDTTEPTTVLGLWGGVASYEEAGYETAEPGSKDPGARGDVARPRA
jgi:quercetin dioxygenase-like cupin family protein